MSNSKLKLTTKEQLNKLFSCWNKIIMYGAGRISTATLWYLNTVNLLSGIDCILVSNKYNNPQKVFGIDVLTISQLTSDEAELIIIATEESSQKSIISTLINYNYKNIKVIGQELYNVLLQEKDYFDDAHLLPGEYESALEKWYYRTVGKKINFGCLNTFNEKIQWIKLYGKLDSMTNLTDKYRVREWIKDKIGDEYLVPLIGVWNDFNEIPLRELPNQFVLKCNHGCAWNEIVRDRSIWDIEATRVKFENWMKTNYAFRGGLQLQYRDIVPKIIAEQYIENSKGDLYDYKFWCFNGKVEFVMFLSERNDGLKMDNFDKEWNHLPFTYNHPNSSKFIPKPQKLSEMINIAETLSEGFPHVRVDLYLLNDDRIKFGEMTFTSCNGICRWNDGLIDYQLGQLIEL